MSRSEPAAPNPPHPKGTRAHLPVLRSDAVQATPERVMADALRAHAQTLGFARIGFAPVQPFSTARERLDVWLAQGHHGDMLYLAGDADRSDPRSLLAEAKGLIVVALPHPTETDRRASEEVNPGPSGIVARYARGADYHSVLKKKLHQLADFAATLLARPVLARACVDTAPLLEREAARLGGVGFIGKNTLAILPGVGSYVLLGELLLDVALDSSEVVAPGCGGCRACLDVCPTGAFIDAYTLDARRCISYLTIEFQGSIPREHRRALGTMVFGCDLCQEICPYNASSKPKPVVPDLTWKERLIAIDLIELLQLTATGYRRLVKGTALRRASREVLQRNAAVALGNSGDPRALPVLMSTLATNPSPLVREHCAWALGRFTTAKARTALEVALNDPNERVRAEAALTLEELRSISLEH